MPLGARSQLREPTIDVDVAALLLIWLVTYRRKEPTDEPIWR